MGRDKGTRQPVLYELTQFARSSRVVTENMVVSVDTPKKSTPRILRALYVTEQCWQKKYICKLATNKLRWEIRKFLAINDGVLVQPSSR